jgi:integrase
MSIMPRPRPPHLLRETTRHGKAVWYVRIDKGPRIRLRSPYGTREFEEEYQAALINKPRPKLGAPISGTLAWLIERYRETAAWAALSAATRRQRENIFKQVLESAGDKPFARISSDIIIAGRERREKTPHQARHFLDAMRGLFRWALHAKHVRTDPTAGVENPRRESGEGFLPWTEQHVAAYQHRWPIGTRQRVWLDVLLYTGLRRGDAVRLGRPHVRAGIATIKTEKSKLKVEVTLPILSVLARTLDAGPCGEMTFICGERGQPLSKESFGNEFKVACRAAGVPGSAHGVRKIAAATAAANGATTSQLMALFGWTTSDMAELYTKAADRQRLAKASAHTLANNERTSIPAPKGKVRAPERKAK